MLTHEITALKRGRFKMQTRLVTWSLAAAGLLASAAAMAQESSGKKIDVRIDAGETYVIDQLSRNTPARIKVINNPNALVVNRGIPGELMLVGAEAGCWEIAAEQTNGESVTYDVTVTSIARPFSKPLAPGKLPYLPDPNCNGFSVRSKSGPSSNFQSKTIAVEH
jgi:hypothetical protein